MGPQDPTQPSKNAIVLLEDKEIVFYPWRDALTREMPDVYVCAGKNCREAWDAISRAEALGYQVVLALVDQHLGDQRDAGLKFLEEFKTRYPDAIRILFSGQSTRDEIQRVLDQGLAHHFVSKTTYADDAECFHALVQKTKALVEGRGGGNISGQMDPLRFRALLKRWMDGLPEGGKTPIMSLAEGRPIPAEELLKDDEFVERLRRSYLACNLNALVMVPEHEGNP
jgi:ActR/RegA family two-component response regulator